ncbi:MAG: response regulator [Pseudomonadota bacterium]|nr:response regulator [Pseudomonadota bacterium]
MNVTDDTPSTCPEAPRLLLVEDDPTSSAFLAAALRGVPAVVDCAQTAKTARELSELHSHDLWLLDAQLPDGNGIDLLAWLRDRRSGVRALAHTASSDPTLHQALMEAGFAQVLVKPLSVVELQSAVQRTLGAFERHPDRTGHSTSAMELWDEQAAARAMNFNQAHMHALRALFLQELPQATRAIMDAAQAGDFTAMATGLHRLQASCGFVGAARLRAAVADLQAAPSSKTLASAFERAAEATAAHAATHARAEHADAAQTGGSGSSSMDGTSGRDE